MGGLKRRSLCRECKKAFEQPTRGRSLLCSDECRYVRDRRQKRAAQRRWEQRRAFGDAANIARIHAESVPPGRRAFTPTEILLIQDAYAKGVRPRMLAERYSVSSRTIHRALELGHPTRVRVGRYVAWFAQRRYGPPVMLTEWVGAGSDVVAA